MLSFSEQCLDLARSILFYNIDAIGEQGLVRPVEGEGNRDEEPGHIILALGEYYRLTGETQFRSIDRKHTYDLVNLAARCLTAQTFTSEDNENGLAYAALGLLSFGASKERNPVWAQLDEATCQELDKRLLLKTDYEGYAQSYNIAKSVARYSMGLSKRDETGRLIDRFVERLQANSSQGFCDSDPTGSLGGCYDIYGLLAFILIRQALQLHANIQLRDHKLPTLRTYAEKYLKLLPELVRSDGLGWAFGQGIGAYGQMHCMSLILQAMRDGWIAESQKGLYHDLLQRLFRYFFVTYLDQEHGYIVVRDHERSASSKQTTRMANFDAVRYLCQWARLAKSVGGSLQATPTAPKTLGRYISFNKTAKKEQGVFIYQDAASGLHVQLPLMSQGADKGSCDALAFPHCPGVFDWPVEQYLPLFVPELRFGDTAVVPCFYAKACTSSLGLRQAYCFKYEQPELITWDEHLVPGLGSCKVSWTFEGGKVISDFAFTVKAPVVLDQMRYAMALGSPHSQHVLPGTLALGPESLRAVVLKDDFQAQWAETQTVTDQWEYRSYWGKLHYLQWLHRDHPLNMRPGQVYRLTLAFEPDLTRLS
jgi:hypothetical protein